jgi:hypothetical protein
MRITYPCLEGATAPGATTQSSLVTRQTSQPASSGSTRSPTIKVKPLPPTMKFSKVQRIEFLLEEIREIVRSIDAPSRRQAGRTHSLPTKTSDEENSEIDVEPSAKEDTVSSSDLQSKTGSPSKSGSSGSFGADPVEICVRCFNGWETRIKADRYDLPGCKFDEGRGRKKCRYCSSRRSECVKVSAKSSFKVKPHSHCYQRYHWRFAGLS